MENKETIEKEETFNSFIFTDPSVELVGITNPTSNISIESFIEDAGRTCYKSFDKKDIDTDEKFCNMLLNSGHTSVFEHVSATFRIECSRSVMAELTRHRLASYSIQSQRFVNYTKKGLTFIKPSWVKWEDVEKISSATNNGEYHFSNTATDYFLLSIATINCTYQKLIAKGWKPEQAREILPNCTATEIVMTANFREWIEILKQRSNANPAAYSEMRVIANEIARILVLKSPTIFKQFNFEE